MKTILFLAAIALAGCSKKGDSAASACSDAIGKGVDAMMNGGGGEMPPAMKAAGDTLKKTITNRCVEDKWSAEVIDCYAKATKRADLSACRQKLPPDQGAKLLNDQMKAMSDMGGMKMHPGGDPGSAAATPPPMPPDGSGMAPPPAGSATK